VDSHYIQAQPFPHNFSLVRQDLLAGGEKLYTNPTSLFYSLMTKEALVAGREVSLAHLVAKLKNEGYWVRESNLKEARVWHYRSR